MDPMTGHGNSVRGAALVALAALLWSSSGLFIKVLPLGALQIAFARSLVAALTIALVVKLRGGRPFPRPDALALACAMSYAGVLVFFVAATKLTTAANAIFLQFSAPIYLVFLEPRLAGRPVARRDLTSVVVCLAAMALFFVGGLFMVEAFSVIIQVASFRLTGRRVFRMSPLHHHFELVGWKEPQIIIRFWIVGSIFALLTLLTLKLR